MTFNSVHGMVQAQKRASSSAFDVVLDGPPPQKRRRSQDDTEEMVDATTNHNNNKQQQKHQLELEDEDEETDLEHRTQIQTGVLKVHEKEEPERQQDQEQEEEEERRMREKVSKEEQKKNELLSHFLSMARPDPITMTSLSPHNDELLSSSSPSLSQSPLKQLPEAPKSPSSPSLTCCPVPRSSSPLPISSTDHLSLPTKGFLVHTLFPLETVDTQLSATIAILSSALVSMYYNATQENGEGEAMKRVPQMFKVWEGYEKRLVLTLSPSGDPEIDNLLGSFVPTEVVRTLMLAFQERQQHQQSPEKPCAFPLVSKHLHLANRVVIQPLDELFRVDSVDSFLTKMGNKCVEISSLKGTAKIAFEKHDDSVAVKKDLIQEFNASIPLQVANPENVLFVTLLKGLCGMSVVRSSDCLHHFTFFSSTPTPRS